MHAPPRSRARAAARARALTIVEDTTYYAYYILQCAGQLLQSSIYVRNVELSIRNQMRAPTPPDTKT
jgi:hypothetical protein